MPLRVRYLTMPPYVKTIAMAVTIWACAEYTLAWMENSEISRAIGFDRIPIKAHAAKEYIYWRLRTFAFTDGQEAEKPKRTYGVIDGLTSQGLLIVKLYEDGQIRPSFLKLADTVITNRGKFRSAAQSISGMDVVFDLYDNDKSAVVWINREPWNITLIKLGAMAADSNPLTNIVDKAFAEFYWRKLVGEPI